MKGSNVKLETGTIGLIEGKKLKKSSNCQITFCGASRELTGSMIHVKVGDLQVLLDAGKFLGKGASEKNQEPFSFYPKELKYVFLSHAHNDHVDNLGSLMDGGFNGWIISTPSTRLITLKNLRDNMKIHGKKPEKNLEVPLKTTSISRIKAIFKTLNFGRVFRDETHQFRLRFIPSEHILGSASIEILSPISLLYTGDLGGGNSYIHGIPKPPSRVPETLIMEGTRGDIRMSQTAFFDDYFKLQSLVEESHIRGGKLLIPASAIGGVQEMLYLLNKVKPGQDIYLDSYMARNVLKIYKNYLLTDKNDLPVLKTIKTPWRRKDLINSQEEAIIISCSSMLTGGPIMKYLESILKKKENTLLFSQHQKIGTLGKAILDLKDYSDFQREKRKIRLNDKEIVIKARIEALEGVSNHADQYQLLEYLGEYKQMPKKIFLVHGNSPVLEILKDAIQEGFPSKVIIPSRNEQFLLYNNIHINKTMSENYPKIIEKNKET